MTSDPARDAMAGPDGVLNRLRLEWRHTEPEDIDAALKIIAEGVRALEARDESTNLQLIAEKNTNTELLQVLRQERAHLAEAEHFGFECSGTEHDEARGILSECGYVVKGSTYPSECPRCGASGQDWFVLSYFSNNGPAGRGSGAKDGTVPVGTGPERDTIRKPVAVANPSGVDLDTDDEVVPSSGHEHSCSGHAFPGSVYDPEGYICDLCGQDVRVIRRRRGSAETGDGCGT